MISSDSPTQNPKEPLRILSVEDNPGDRLLIQRFLNALSQQFKVYFTEDGSQALEFLFRKGNFVSSPRPDLVLLDLNLQKKDGRAVLAEIRSSHETKDIPVFILTTSQSAEDRKHCLELGAQKFITKPDDVVTYGKVFEGISQWLSSHRKGEKSEKGI